MTTAALIKSLKPGELVIRCADGSLLQTITTISTPPMRGGR